MPRSDRLIEIFHEAEARAPGPERDEFLGMACGGDAELMERVRRLLQAHESASEGNFLGARAVISPELEAELTRFKPEQVGDRIGPYKLRERIGEGGFGVVWVAEQEFPIRRTVALKIIKLGMDTTDVVARFEQERQALAMMDHPHIARVFEAGATEHGRPFFVMELVRGIKITEYCDQASLPTAKRLALFTQVCQAVQHAHQKGIIHRDLKPSNVLVTLHDGVPVPKVIDFGVAKATQGRIVEHTIYTQFQQMIGTPLYMSPEQAEMSGLDVDTRTDIYALGVLLYELLTGRTPFDPDRLTKVGYDEMRRVIREEEPQKPSTALNTMAAEKLTSVANRRSIEPPKLIHTVYGDLDWIVMKCLEKDRSRRYETASDVASDIHRHLANEPVLASPPAFSYRLRKLIIRHKTAVLAGSLLLVTLVSGLVGTTSSMVRAREAEHQAVASQREGSKQLLASLVAQARATRFSGQPGRRFDSLELLRRARKIARDLQLPPETLRTMRNEATAALAVSDLQLAGPWTAFPSDGYAADFDESFSICAITNGKGDCSIRRVGTEIELHHLPGLGSHALVYLTPDARYVIVLHQHPDGKAMNICHIWDLGQSTPKRIFQASAIFSVALQSSELVALGHWDGTIQVLRLHDAKEIHRLPEQHRMREVQIALHPFEPLVAASSYFGEGVEIRDMRTGAMVRFLPQESRVTSVTWTPDGRTLALGFAEAQRVDFHRIGSWERSGSLPTEQAVTAMAFSKSGHVMAITGWASILEVFDIPAAKKMMVAPYMGYPTALPRFSSDGLRLSAAVRDRRLGTFKVGAPAGMRQLIRQNSPPDVMYWRFSIHPQGSLVVAAMDDALAFWNLRTGREAGLIPAASKDNAKRVHFESSGSLLAGSINGISRWPIASAADADGTHSVGPPERLPLPVAESISQSRDGRFIATADRAVGAHAPHAGVWLLRAQQPDQPQRLERGVDMTSATLSPDGRWLFTVSRSGLGKLWNAQTGEFVKQLVEVIGPGSTFTTDGRWLITAGVSGYVISTETWEPVRPIHAIAVACAPDSRLMAELIESGVRLVELTTGEEIAFLERPDFENMSGLAFTPDGTSLLVQQLKRGIEIWDLRIIREQLKEMNLDWKWPEFPPDPSGTPASTPTIRLRLRDESARF